MNAPSLTNPDPPLVSSRAVIGPWPSEAALFYDRFFESLREEDERNDAVELLGLPNI